MWSSCPWVSTTASIGRADPDVVEVEEDEVDPWLVVLGEQRAAVDHQQAPGLLEDRHVPPDLAQSTQGGRCAGPPRPAAGGREAPGGGGSQQVRRHEVVAQLGDLRVGGGRQG